MSDIQVACIDPRRAAVVAEARKWLRTPFKWQARLQGIGADCANFPAAVYEACGVFAENSIEHVSPQWHLNQRREIYLEYARRHAAEYSIDERTPQPGDFVIVKHRWVYAHGAIVVQWPIVVHCYPPCVMESNVLHNPVFASQQFACFDPFSFGDRP